MNRTGNNMPLIPVILGLGIWGGSIVAGWGDRAAEGVTGIPGANSATATTKPVLPGWVIPGVLVIVGGVLVYKYGAKVLKV